MDLRSAYRLQLMEKIGAPLLAALPGGMDGEKAAETVAALIGKSIEAGLSLSQAMKLSDDDGDIDSIRLSLAALTAPLLARAYKDSGKMPDEAALATLTKGLEAALVFSENFTAAIDHTARLKSLHEPLPMIDTAQISLLTLSALAPAVQAVQQFSFGQSGPVLIKDIAARLEGVAAQLAASADGSEGDQAFARLMLLRALAEMYAACHMRQVSAHEGEAEPDIASVWAAFEEQAAMLLALSGAAVPGGEVAADTTAPAAPDPQTPPLQSASPAAPASPMGFFKKGGESEAPPAESGPESGPTPDLDNSSPPAADPSPAPASAPPTSKEGANPMSFFKPGAKKPADDA